MLYSLVRNSSSLSRTHLACSTDPHLARFFLLICREPKNMSRAFFGTVPPSCLLWLCWPLIVEYKTSSTSRSDWQFLFFVSLMMPGTCTQKNCRRNCSRRQLSTILAGGVGMSGLKGTFSLVSSPTMETKRCWFGTISDSSTRFTACR